DVRAQTPPPVVRYGPVDGNVSSTYIVPPALNVSRALIAGPDGAPVAQSTSAGAVSSQTPTNEPPRASSSTVLPCCVSVSADCPSPPFAKLTDDLMASAPSIIDVSTTDRTTLPVFI